MREVGSVVASNPHVHSRFCDGKNTVMEMAEGAMELGFVSLGFSGHSPQTVPDTWYMTDTDGYVRAVNEAKAVCAGKMRVWLGIELERLYDCDVSPYEYVIGASHYVKADGKYYAVDSMDDMEAAFEGPYRRDGIALARDYYDTVRQCAHALPMRIFAHFDLVRKRNGDGKGRMFDTGDPAYRRLALGALEEVRESGALLEVNTGGMARGYLPTPYPEPFILCAWREMGGGVIVGGDSHEVRTLDYAFGDAVRLMKDAGFQSAWRLGAGDALFDEYAI